MEIGKNLHRIRVDFTVTEEIKRFVYIYLIVSEQIHIIDTGVDGSEKIIEHYLSSLGRNISEVKNVLLTHSHPDHIGGAYAIKQLSGCTVHACAPEQYWIENIDTQFKERPIPNFYALLNKSVLVDKILHSNDVLLLEDGITIKVIDTKGHSLGSLSFLWVEQGELFTGDAIPVVGDIPIYVSVKDSISTLKNLMGLEGVSRYLSAWDNVYDRKAGEDYIQKSLTFLLHIDNAVKEIFANTPNKDMQEIYRQVCCTLDLEHLIANPLFLRSVLANISEIRA